LQRELLLMRTVTDVAGLPVVLAEARTALGAAGTEATAAAAAVFAPQRPTVRSHFLIPTTALNRLLCSW